MKDAVPLHSETNVIASISVSPSLNYPEKTNSDKREILLSQG